MPNKLPHFEKKDAEIVQRDALYSGNFLNIFRYHLRHRLFDGGWSDVFTREVLERYSAAAILPYDPVQDRVILIEQFRPGTLTHEKNPWQIEIPAGVLDNNQNPEQVAYSEAEEEAGCMITELYPIYNFFVSPGGSNEYLNLYCGRANLTHIEGTHGLKQEHEDILVHNLSYEQAIKKLAAGEIQTTPAIISLLWLQLNREKLRNLWK